MFAERCETQQFYVAGTEINNVCRKVWDSTIFCHRWINISKEGSKKLRNITIWDLNDVIIPLGDE